MILLTMPLNPTASQICSLFYIFYYYAIAAIIVRMANIAANRSNAAADKVFGGLRAFPGEEQL